MDELIYIIAYAIIGMIVFSILHRISLKLKEVNDTLKNNSVEFAVMLSSIFWITLPVILIAYWIHIIIDYYINKIFNYINKKDTDNVEKNSSEI